VIDLASSATPGSAASRGVPQVTHVRGPLFIAAAAIEPGAKEDLAHVRCAGGKGTGVIITG